MTHRPFDIDLAMKRIRRAVKAFPQAALFALRDQGHGTVFEQLVACVISVRTRDEVTLPTALRLFSRARTARELAGLDPAETDRLLREATFHRAKARTLQLLARRVSERYGDQPPGDRAELQSLPGIGPKCANLVLGVACGRQAIAVDVHVHRVTNRWGYVHAATPEKTAQALESLLPERYWTELNERLVPFGKNVCTGSRPRCSRCPVADMCRRVGVRAWR